MPVVEQIMATDGFQKIMETIGSESPVLMSASSYDYSQADTLVNVLYKFQDATWGKLLEQMPGITDIAQSTMSQVTHLNSFLGINIGEQPSYDADTGFPDILNFRDHPGDYYSRTCRSDTVHQRQASAAACIFRK